MPCALAGPVSGSRLVVCSPTSWQLVDDPSNPLEMLVRVARQLGDIRGKFAFLGGTTSSLFVTDTGGPAPRSTKDVDAIVRCESYGEYYGTLARELKGRGFVED